MGRNPFSMDAEEIADLEAAKARDLQARYEQEIQELDETEIAQSDSMRNRVMDRLIPGRERRRAEQFAEVRDAAELELSAATDYELYGPQESGNDETLYLEQDRESEEQGTDLGRW